MSKTQEKENKSSNHKDERDKYLNSKKNFTPNEYEDFGYYFYPQRMKLGHIEKPAWYEKFFSYGESREIFQKAMCEENVEKCLKNHPGVKLILSAMKSVGCEPNLMRHFSCEKCDKAVRGGYDPSTNQSILCYNTIDSHRSEEVANELIRSLIQSFDYCRSNYNMFDLRHLACTQIILCHNQVYEYKDCAEILSHELIHAFDYCRASIDINNNYHVACTEIRAANLTSCSLMDALANDSAAFHIKNAQKAKLLKECVRRKAALSLQMVRNITEEEAFRAVDTVFEKCYKDTSPFGRRVLSFSDCDRAYKDRKLFGYN